MAPKQSKETENTKAQMRKGILEFCILLVISQRKVYASDILKKLKQADLIVMEGTLYPILSRLKNLGLLQYHWEESKSGPPRKYYYLTDKGEESLRGLEESWKRINKSISSLLKNN
ncbi:MAG TPA: PadR family transcriptional regulator [Patescibacteria group bacterium]|nr:PadR family transcriptional regulator [Patescibacteria group bacterium]